MNTMRPTLAVLAGLLLIWIVGSTGHIPGTPHAPPAAEQTNSDPNCQANLIATDGSPPPGTPHLGPQQLCNALSQAEQDATCMGDWQPPNPDRINARQFCIELHQRGCGDPSRDCEEIPQDQTYYTHH